MPYLHVDIVQHQKNERFWQTDFRGASPTDIVSKSPSFYTKENGESPERMKTDVNLREMNRMACIADIIIK
jgi:hypothetical protein